MQSLTQKEKFEAYIIPFYALVTGTHWGYRKRVKKEFEKKANGYKFYGEDTKAELFMELEGKANKVFTWFNFLWILFGLLIIIFLD